MEKKMNIKGWEKLFDDPLNPSLEPSNSGVSEWQHTFDQLNQPIHTRYDFWKDEKRNVIEYRFSYGNRYGQNKKYEECLLEGSSRYIPRDILHKALEEIERVEKEERDTRNPRRSK
jgi:hypothetical protein